MRPSKVSILFCLIAAALAGFFVFGQERPNGGGATSSGGSGTNTTGTVIISNNAVNLTNLELPRINLNDFGMSTSLADNSAAFNAAMASQSSGISWANTNGASFYLSNGTYNFTTNGIIPNWSNGVWTFNIQGCTFYNANTVGVVPYNACMYRWPSSQAAAQAMTAATINFNGGTWYGVGPDTNQCGLVLAATSLSQLNGCTFKNLSYGLDAYFDLWLSINNPAGGCYSNAWRLQGGTNKVSQIGWSGASTANSSCNDSIIQNGTDFAQTAEQAELAIYGCDNITVFNMNFEGNNPVCCVSNYDLDATVVKTFRMVNTDVENTPTDSILCLGFGQNNELAIFDGLYDGTATSHLIDASGSGNTGVAVENINYLSKIGTNFIGLSGQGWSIFRCNAFPDPSLTNLWLNTQGAVNGIGYNSGLLLYAPIVKTGEPTYTNTGNGGLEVFQNLTAGYDDVWSGGYGASRSAFHNWYVGTGGIISGGNILSTNGGITASNGSILFTNRTTGASNIIDGTYGNQTNLAGTNVASQFIGGGAGLTGLNAAALTSGTLPFSTLSGVTGAAANYIFSINGANNGFAWISTGAGTQTPITATVNYAGYGATNIGTNVSSNYFNPDPNSLSNAWFGFGAYKQSATGGSNAFFGDFAGAALTSGTQNAGFGFTNMAGLTSGGENAAFGYAALQNVAGNSYNSFLGARAGQLYTGQYGVGIGYESLYAVSGNFNTGVGYSALYNLTTGSNNIGVGYQAGLNWSSGTAYSNNIAIGNYGVAGDTGTTRIGTSPWQTNCIIAGLLGITNSVIYGPLSFTATGWTNTNSFACIFTFPLGATNVYYSNAVPALVYGPLTNAGGYSDTIGAGCTFTNASALTKIRAWGQ